MCSSTLTRQGSQEPLSQEAPSSRFRCQTRLVTSLLPCQAASSLDPAPTGCLSRREWTSVLADNGDGPTEPLQAIMPRPGRTQAVASAPHAPLGAEEEPVAALTQRRQTRSS